MRDESINFIFTILEKVDFQTIGTALLMILIPLAIAILSNYYEKKEDKTKDFAILDLHVILDGVFKFQWLLIYVASIFLPTMFWEIFSSRGSHFIEITLSVMGIWFMVRTLFVIYRWIKGNPFEFRFSYLWCLNNENHEDMEAVWDSVWQTKNIDMGNERTFFKIFSSKIEQLLKTDEKFETTSKLLDNFKNFINNRLAFSSVSETLPKILEWHYRNEKIYFNAAEKSVFLYEIRQVLSSIIELVGKRALKECGFDAFLSQLYLEKLKKHSELRKNEERYLKRLFRIFYNIFFENIGNIPVRERYDIWKYFQSECSEWVVIKENLEGENNLISRISLVCFLNWAQERIERLEEKFDEKLDDVAKNLFPKVEPITWSIILIFCLKSWGSNRIKDVIEHPWNFGKSRGYLGDGEGEGDLFEAMKSQIKSEKRNTFELTVVLSKYYPLFRDISTKVNLECYIKDLEGLEGEYKNDPSKEAKESKRLELLHIFKEMAEFLNDREKQVS